jgi:isocitrate dehydrogenase
MRTSGSTLSILTDRVHSQSNDTIFTHLAELFFTRSRRYVAPTMKIAVMPGDGVGKEVVPEGLAVLKEVARKFKFTYTTTDYPFGGEHYLKTGQTLPDSALKELAAHDAILFGAVGVDPRGSAQIPQGILETEILLKMRFELDQYVSICGPTRLLPGVPTPLKNATGRTISTWSSCARTPKGFIAAMAGFFTRTRRMRWPIRSK